MRVLWFGLALGSTGHGAQQRQWLLGGPTPLNQTYLDIDRISEEKSGEEANTTVLCRTTLIGMGMKSGRTPNATVLLGSQMRTALCSYFLCSVCGGKGRGTSESLGRACVDRAGLSRRGENRASELCPPCAFSFESLGLVSLLSR